MEAVPSLTPGLDGILGSMYLSEMELTLPSDTSDLKAIKKAPSKRKKRKSEILSEDPSLTNPNVKSEEKEKPKRRKKVLKMEESNQCVEDIPASKSEIDQSAPKPIKTNFRRRNIRKVISENKVNEETRAAQLAETERLKRVAERDELLRQQENSIKQERWEQQPQEQQNQQQLHEMQPSQMQYYPQSNWYPIPPSTGTVITLSSNMQNSCYIPQQQMSGFPTCSFSNQTQTTSISDPYQLPSAQTLLNEIKPPILTNFDPCKLTSPSQAQWMAQAATSLSNPASNNCYNRGYCPPANQNPPCAFTQQIPFSSTLPKLPSMVEQKSTLLEGASAATAISLCDSNEEEDAVINEQFTPSSTLSSGQRSSYHMTPSKDQTPDLEKRQIKCSPPSSVGIVPFSCQISTGTNVSQHRNESVFGQSSNSSLSCPTLTSLLSSPTIVKPVSSASRDSSYKDEALHNEVIELSDDDEDEDLGTSKASGFESDEADESISSLIAYESTAVKSAVLSECSKDRMHKMDANGCVVINPSHSDKEDDILLHPRLAPRLKPHQIGGIRFLYDNVIESLEQFRNSEGFGCILAHSMGLGKTVQVIGFLEVFFRAVPSAHTVLLVVPINTLLNWQSEFDYWVPCLDGEVVVMDDVKVNESNSNDKLLSGTSSSIGTQSGSNSQRRPFKLFVLREHLRNIDARHKYIMEWHRQGGVLLMGYEMFRLLVNRPLKKLPTKTMESFSSMGDGLRHSISAPTIIDVDAEDKHKSITTDLLQALCDPGPQMVICDEGHRIKNSEAGISKALKRIRTRRRIVLTGYPLQNNLLEYWCMVDFVRPNYLGNRPEFTNMFQRPIENGQCVDSNEEDRKLMQGRAHVLHELLNGFVLRRSHAVLKGSLPHGKQEFVLCVRMSAWQRRLYVAFMRSLKINFSENSLTSESQQTSSNKGRSNPSTMENPYNSTDGPDSAMAKTWDLIYRGGVSSNPVSSQTSAVQHSNPSTFIECGFNTLKAYAMCCKIWNHPDVLYQILMDRRTSGEMDLDDLDDLLASLQTDEVFDANMPAASSGAKEELTSSEKRPITSEFPTPVVKNTARRGGGRGRGRGRGTDVLTRLRHTTSYNTSRSDEAQNDPVLVSAESLCESSSSQTRPSPLSGVDYLWAQTENLWNGYIFHQIENSGKFVLLMTLIDETIRVGDRILVFSQSLKTLDLIEYFLSQRTIPSSPRLSVLNNKLDNVSSSCRRWIKNENYFRLDGSTSSLERDRQISSFNPPSSPYELFLLSTKAGCLGINLIGANRVVMMDASWNPCHDCQAVCRIYRYGQQKPCYIYRFIADNSMEKKIYDRQVAKQGMADRVVDELNPNAHFTRQQVDVLLEYNDSDPGGLPFNVMEEVLSECPDQILCTTLQQHSDWVTKKPFTHESLLIDRKDIRLTQREKIQAKKRYESDRFMARAGHKTSFGYYQPPDCLNSGLLDPKNQGLLLNAARQATSDRQLQAILAYVNSLSKGHGSIPRSEPPNLASPGSSHPSCAWRLPLPTHSNFPTISTSAAEAEVAATQLQLEIEERRLLMRKQRLSALMRELNEAKEKEKQRVILSSSNETNSQSPHSAVPINRPP